MAGPRGRWRADRIDAQLLRQFPALGVLHGSLL
jgi:hypothetical protein